MTHFYRAARVVVRVVMRGLWDVRVEGEENVPREGPCVLAPNHQSALDPFLVQGACTRPVFTMTKSTQFSRGLFRWILPRGGAFPVRRYRTDPQAVRVLLRHLNQDRVVCVYPEGERTWDGEIGPFRRGTLRVLLRAGVPVVPVGIDGMYDIWPRWSSRPRLGLPVNVRFGKPILFGAYRERAARESALPMAELRLREALLRLSGEAARKRARRNDALEKSGRGGGAVPT